MFTLEAATISNILCFFDQGNFNIFIRDKSGNFEKDVCGNHAFIIA